MLGETWFFSFRSLRGKSFTVFLKKSGFIVSKLVEYTFDASTRFFLVWYIFPFPYYSLFRTSFWSKVDTIISPTFIYRFYVLNLKFKPPFTHLTYSWLTIEDFQFV